MAIEDDLDGLSRTERLVLCGVLELHVDGETPVRLPEVRSHCRERLAATDEDVIGDLTGSEATRALNRLEAAGLVAESDVNSSTPVGKGRPAYEPAVEPERVVEALDRTELFGVSLDRLVDSE